MESRNLILSRFTAGVLGLVFTMLLLSCSERDEIAPNEEVNLKADIGCGQASNGYAYCPSGSSADPDGDGWGWESNQSCIVHGSSADPGGNYTCGGGGSGCGTASNGYPICCNASSDPDGDGWGWENNQSCVVQSGGGSSSGGGSCPSSLSCPSGMSCGCYTVSGLGSNKNSYRNSGAERSFLASAMMETEQMTTNYTYGDGKTGDSFNAGACKQNWGMMRQCHSAWNQYGSGDYAVSAAMNSNKGLDVQVYYECRNYYGDNWFAGHRNGASGLSNPNTQDINNFKSAYNWTYNHIAGHETDDVRFWVSVPAI